MGRAVRTILNLLNEIAKSYGVIISSETTYDEDRLATGFIVIPECGQSFIIFISDEDVTELYSERFGEEKLDEQIASDLEKYFKKCFMLWSNNRDKEGQHFYQGE